MSQQVKLQFTNVYQSNKLMLNLVLVASRCYAQASLKADNARVFAASAATQVTCSLNKTYANKTNSTIRDKYKSMFFKLYQNNDIVNQIRKALHTGDFSTSGLMKDNAKIVLTVMGLVPYLIISFALFLLLIPFLGCLYCCDKKCPSKICRQKKCKFTYPIIAFVFVGLILGIALIGVAYYVTIADSITQFQCQTFHFLDSLSGGIIDEANSTYFVGIGPAINELTDLKASFNQLVSKSSNLSTHFNTTNQAYNNFNVNMLNNFNNFTNPVYSNAFYQADGTTAFTVSSEFKQLYFGPYTNQNSLYYTTKQFMDSINALLGPILTDVSEGSDYLQSNFAMIQDSLDKSLTILQDLNNTIGPIISTIMGVDTKAIDAYVRYSLIGFFLLPFIASVLSISSIILMFDGKSYKNSMYFCAFLFGISFLVCFLLSLVVGVLTPVSLVICQDPYLLGNFTLKQAGLGASSFSTIQECLRGGLLVSEPSYQSLSEIDRVTAISRTFDKTLRGHRYTIGNIDSIVDRADSIITYVQNSDLLDIKNASALEHLRRLSSKAYSLSNCKPVTANESWVPNVWQSHVQCAQGVRLVRGNCSDLNADCIAGCRSFTWQFGTSYNNCTLSNCTLAGQVASQLTTHYGVDCIYTTLLTNLNRNYDTPRQSSLAALKTALKGPSGGVKAIKDYREEIVNLKTKFQAINDVIYRLQPSLGSNTSLFAGVRCSPLPQLLSKTIESYCTNVYTDLIPLSIVLPLMLYSIVFAICFLICVARNADQTDPLPVAQEVIQIQMITDSQVIIDIPQ